MADFYIPFCISLTEIILQMPGGSLIPPAISIGFTCLVESKPVKQEVSCRVILPPMVIDLYIWPIETFGLETQRLQTRLMLNLVHN